MPTSSACWELRHNRPESMIRYRMESGTNSRACWEKMREVVRKEEEDGAKN